MTALRPLRVRNLGRVSYRDAYDLQESLVAARQAGEGWDTLLLLEHPPVITLGRGADHGNVRFPGPWLEARGVELVESDRGGDATFHGPGQLMAYPILDLRPDWKDVRRFVAALEFTMIATLADYGLSAAPLAGYPGVWLSAPERKIGAIGARIRRWVTNHGLALNVNTDLSYFDLIVPCGIPDKGVTSLQRELGHEVPLAEVASKLTGHLAQVFGRTIVEVVDG